MIVAVCRYMWTCSVFLSGGRSCFSDQSVDSVLLPRSVSKACVVRPVVLSGDELRSDASEFLFTLTIWKSGRPRTNTTQLLSMSDHSAGDHSVSVAVLE